MGWAVGIQNQKPGFSNNTFANFPQRLHPKGYGYTNKACEGRLKFLQAAKAAFVCIATPFRVSDFGEGIV